jgi:osmoprotectant transport system substrate-binding protein
LKWLKPYGFNNTYAIAVTAELAKAHALQKISDLKPYASSLVFAANQDFYMSADGFNGLVQTYGITFKDKRQLDIDPKYEAIADGRVDVINAFATDGSLIAHKLVVLTDDKDYFTDYQGTTLVRMDTLRKYPELEPVLNKLADQLSDADMQRLNYQIDQEKRPIAEVARNFLTSKGLLPVKKQAK